MDSAGTVSSTDTVPRSAKSSYSGSWETISIYAWGGVACLSICIGVGAALFPGQITSSDGDIVASVRQVKTTQIRLPKPKVVGGNEAPTLKPKMPTSKKELLTNADAEKLNPFPVTEPTKTGSSGKPGRDEPYDKIQARASDEIPETLDPLNTASVPQTQLQPSPGSQVGEFDLSALKPSTDASVENTQNDDALSTDERVLAPAAPKDAKPAQAPVKKRRKLPPKKKLDLGVDIGGAKTVADLMERYRALSGRAPDLFKRIKPLVHLVEINDELQARLVAGPFLSATKTYTFCRELRLRFSIPCSRTKYQGRTMPKLKF